jgi:exodeoxyribonuclease VII large subunit
VQALDAAPDVDVIVLARGGGDGAQLLPWSDEALCRALCACTTPVVSAIGHEGDRPLCDEVADLRCGTPSLAAGAVVPDRALLLGDLAARRAAMDEVLRRRVDGAVARLGAVDRQGALRAGVSGAAGRLERAVGRLELLHPDRLLAVARDRLAAEWRQVEALSPVRVMERGYAVVRKADGAVVRRAGDVGVDETLDVQVAAGRIAARVEGVDG